MIKLRTLLIAIAVLFAFPVLVASADAPPGPFFNGFETDTAGWFDNGGTITRVADGSISSYANGINAASGTHYARLAIDPSPGTCASGGGPQPVYSGPFTRWGGYSSTFPMGGYSTGVDIYLDVPYAQAHPDARFDWDSAVTDTSGAFRRDFVFNVGTDALGFVINAGNNATRCGANPNGGPTHIVTSGWYTFEHTFSGTSGSPLVATLRVIQESTNAVVGTWVLSDPTDIIGTTVGGNRYGWFVQNEFDGLAIDNSFRTGIGPPATLTLAPATATNTVGTQHCVTATVTDVSGNRLENVVVRFSVPTAAATDASPSSGSATTDASGQATFCYSASLPGEDTITAYADTNGNAMQDAGEPSGAATKTWTLPTSTSLCQVTITEGGWIIANNGDRANFGGNAQVSADGSTVQGQQEFQDQGPVQPMNVHSIQLTATTCTSDMTAATIFGTATIDGAGTHAFRIDVTDHGSPGSSDSYGIILDTGYASGQKTLQGGNVTIHK